MRQCILFMGGDASLQKSVWNGDINEFYDVYNLLTNLYVIKQRPESRRGKDCHVKRLIIDNNSSHSTILCIWVRNKI